MTGRRRDDHRGTRARESGRSVVALRWASAVVFVVFGAGKFANHAAELSSFRQYGLPFAEGFVFLIGAVEILGGALLLVGPLVRPAACLLAIDMIGAIIVSGIARGEAIGLTLAPALLAAMIVVVRNAAPRSSSGRHAARSPRRADGG